MNYKKNHKMVNNFKFTKYPIIHTKIHEFNLTLNKFSATTNQQDSKKYQKK